MKKIFFVTLLLASAAYTNCYAERLTVNHLYYFAHNNDEQALSYYSRWINMRDENGNTALCVAAQNNDKHSYYLLQKYGASSRVECVKRVAQGSASQKGTTTNDGTFLGMGKLGWGITGALVAGGGIAIAAGGGGGGGSGEGKGSLNGSDSSSSNNDSGQVYMLDNGEDVVVGKVGDVNNSSIVLKNEVKTKDENGRDKVLEMYGIYHTNNVANASRGESGSITIVNNNSPRVVGVHAGNTDLLDVEESDDDTGYEDRYATALNARNNGTGNINIVNNGNGDAYGLYAIWNATNSKDYAKGTINITNKGSGNAYGAYGEYYANNAESMDAEEISDLRTGIITMTNESAGNVYGLYGKEYAMNGSGDGNGVIDITNKGNGNAYGIYSQGDTYSVYYGGSSIIKIKNEGSGTAYALYGINADNYHSDSITMVNNEKGISIGTYSTEGAYNSGDITIHNLGNGTAIGMYTDGGTVENSGNITIEQTEQGMAFGIYGTKGSIIKNSGTIKINGGGIAYGIYSEGSSVTNTGTISIDGNTNHENAIKLNGGALFNGGVISADNLNLDTFGGTNVATANAQYVAEDALSGTLAMSADIVSEGNALTYTTYNTIQASDVSGLHLTSQSALFDATLADNGKDVNLTMKSFSDVVSNKSLADFLQNNYAANNGEDLFKNLKSFDSLHALNDSLDDFVGKDMFNRFAFEDFTLMRELNYDINQKLFNNEEDYISTSGSTSSFAFSGNSRYSLTNQRSGNRSWGLSVAFTDVNSTDRNDDNRRADKMYNISMPMGYNKSGISFISTPRIGYAYGTYDREGFDGKNYDGTMEKQMFGFMNEARYPLTLGGWTIAPSAEFNVISYRISGYEDGEQAYRLKIKDQNNYSIESGLGINASKQIKFGEKSKLSFNGGVAVYHEFADPYKIKLGMNGMSGSFTIRDENRSDNRAVIRSGFDFTHENLSFGGNIISYIDREYHTNANLDFRYNF